MDRTLLLNGSIEILPNTPRDADAVGQELPKGTAVFVTHLQRFPLETGLGVMERLHAAGLNPIPHLAARRIASLAEVSTFLRQAVSRCGVKQALVIGGETDQPVGPYTTALALLETGVVKDSGLTEVGLAAYPDGHPKIAAAQLTAALDEKLKCASAQGLKPHIVTQFCFSAEQIASFVVGLRSSHPGTPIRIGLAGPTSLMALLKYARLCGVPAASKFIGGNTSDAMRLAAGTDPGGLIASVTKQLAAAGLHDDLSVHLFSFGGPQKTAAWLRSAMA